MNDYGNNIILASQAGCDLVLITEEGGDFPVGSKVFYYDDNDGVRKSFDITKAKSANNVFENNQNIAVDWEADLPLLEKSASMFAGSNIKSFYYKSVYIPYFALASNMFNGCNQLKKIKELLLRCSKPGDFSHLTTISINNICKGCNNLEYVKISCHCEGTALGLSGAFEGCVSLIDLNLYIRISNAARITATDMFKDCKLNSKLLQQLFDSLPTTKNATPITIGYDPELVDPNVDKPEGSELTWAEAFAEKKWTVTWEAYVEPVENTPKMLMAKAPKQKLYKLDEIPDEMVEAMDDFTVYVKGGKHYLMTSGDSVTAPGTDGALLRDTEVENVIRAGSLQEAIDLLGVTLAEK